MEHSLSEQQKKIEQVNKEELQVTVDRRLAEIIDEVREITKSRHLTAGEKQTFQSRKGCSAF
ncbi:MAG: hypothetical protein ACLRTD_26080 [Bacteroides sp.]